jgi:phosphoribosylamine--glycine ligase/phosphoribosylformylglycinamidine cyclo-ligase
MEEAERLRVLLIGNGGRSMPWPGMGQSPRVEAIYVAPGNGGTASGSLSKVSNISSPKADDFDGLMKFAKEQKINLVVPGPEAP